MSKATKLRFALITEDVLDKLRPRSQSENARSKYMDEIYMVIRTAVNEAVDEKLQQLSTTINQMVEERVLKILEQHGFGRSMAGGSGSVGRKRDHKEAQEKESAKGAGECSSALKLANLKRRRPKKNNNPSVTFATEEQLAKKPRTKAQKITVMPIHRENQVKSSPSTGNNAPLLPTPPPLHMDHNALDAEDDDDDNFSDVEEPSILTIAAKYLKKLEDSRRRKQQQQH